MKSIILKDHEVRVLIDHGEVMVVRVVSNKINPILLNEHFWNLAGFKTHKHPLSYCPLGQVGERRWVKETWADTNGENGPMISYKAGGDRFLVDDSFPVDYSRYPGCTFTMWCGDLRRGEPDHSWRSLVRMPQWASRLTTENVSVECRQVQTISPKEVVKTGTKTLPEEGTLSWAINCRERFFENFAGENQNPWCWFVLVRRVD